MIRPVSLLCMLLSSSAVIGAPALLAPVDAPSGRLREGAPLYYDRTYQMYKPHALLENQPYLSMSISGGEAMKVLRGGSLIVITPIETSPYSQSKVLKDMGFALMEDIAPFQLHGSNPCDVCQVWTGTVSEGQEIVFGKWAVTCGFDPSNQVYEIPESMRALVEGLRGTPYAHYEWDICVNKPDFVVFMPKQPMDITKRNPALPGDTYNDHFQVIYDEQRKMLFAFWTQASREADIDQHIAFSRSFDGGLSWTEPVILAGSPNKKNPGLLASWQQPMLAKSGRLYCLWNQQTTSRGPHCGMMFGSYSDDAGETWSAPKMVPFKVRMDNDPADITIPPSWCNWQRPLRLGEGGKFLVGVSRHGKAPYDERSGCKIDFMQFENIDDNPAVQDIELKHFCTNQEALRAPSGLTKYEPAAEEAGIVKLPDGRLFALMRSSVGSPLWSQSRDNGVIWTQPQPLKDAAGNVYLHPRSPCPIYDWKGCEAGSGMYFALVHNTFDYEGENAYQNRGPLYLIAGRFDANAEQPIQFSAPKLFAPRRGANSFYTSYTVVDGTGILWFPDKKFYLLGKKVDDSWFKD